MKTDVTFVHPPSIYNFRSRNLRPGPISDVVPSTPVFEMYPIGLISMLNYLTTRGYDARISNLAVLMLSSSTFDEEAYLKGLDSDVFGVDLHWLPHVHGAINVVRTLKRLHPESKVVLGGYSASYFAEEIMQTYPEVDYVLKGDLQERPMLDLVEYTQGKGDVEDIENLLYRQNGAVKSNK
ncbi:MAG TPA: cobalamin-dependent protein, partial [Thermoplasmataceae archaeon]|nr:cobalamin-dependent protein [Thermoplasmataceae archaeon]